MGIIVNLIRRNNISAIILFLVEMFIKNMYRSDLLRLWLLQLLFAAIALDARNNVALKRI